MDRLKRVAIIAELADKLIECGSWCGETHIQKAMYLLQEATRVPLQFQFVLYKHGPFSFDLRDELTSMRADELLSVETRLVSYGPRLRPTSLSQEIRSRFPRTLNQFREKIESVGSMIQNRDVGSLERLATAFFVTLQNPEEDRVRLLVRLKPHIPFNEWDIAIREVDSLRRKLPS